MNSPSNHNTEDKFMVFSGISSVNKPPTVQSLMLQELRSQSQSKENTHSKLLLKNNESDDDEESLRCYSDGCQLLYPDSHAKLSATLQEDHAPKKLFKTQTVSPKKLPHEHAAWANIIRKLPMFQERVMYPEYVPSMIQYRKEAEVLSNYMEDVYQNRPYERDSKGLIKFPIKERWLRGEEYGFLLRHYKTYEAIGFYPVHIRQQDPIVYEQPRNGMLYYIKGFHLREFGFPRLRDSENTQQRKDFKWKKTNFVTDLPKHSPISRYLVAKSRNKDENYFMHSSVLYQEYNGDYKNPAALKKLKEKHQKLRDEDIEPAPELERLILCHILEKDDQHEVCHDDDDDFEEKLLPHKKEQFKEDEEYKEVPLYAQTFSSHTEYEESRDLPPKRSREPQQNGSLLKKLAVKESHSLTSMDNSQNSKLLGVRRSSRIKEVHYGQKSNISYEYLQALQTAKGNKKREVKALVKQSSKNISVSKTALVKEPQAPPKEVEQPPQEQPVAQMVQQPSFHEMISRPYPMQYPIQQFGQESVQSFPLDDPYFCEKYSSLNDSDTTDDNIVSVLSQKQIKNILKEFEFKFTKWRLVENFHKDKWYQKRKVNYYNQKINKWRKRILEQPTHQDHQHHLYQHLFNPAHQPTFQMSQPRQEDYTETTPSKQQQPHPYNTAAYTYPYTPNPFASTTPQKNISQASVQQEKPRTVQTQPAKHVQQQPQRSSQTSVDYAIRNEFKAKCAKLKSAQQPFIRQSTPEKSKNGHSKRLAEQAPVLETTDDPFSGNQLKGLSVDVPMYHTRQSNGYLEKKRSMTPIQGKGLFEVQKVAKQEYGVVKPEHMNVKLEQSSKTDSELSSLLRAYR